MDMWVTPAVQVDVNSERQEAEVVSAAVSVSKKVPKLEKQQETLAMELLRCEPGFHWMNEVLFF
jgi:hypothetical protein